MRTEPAQFNKPWKFLIVYTPAFILGMWAVITLVLTPWLSPEHLTNQSFYVKIILSLIGVLFIFLSLKKLVYVIRWYQKKK